MCEECARGGERSTIQSIHSRIWTPQTFEIFKKISISSLIYKSAHSNGRGIRRAGVCACVCVCSSRGQSSEVGTVQVQYDSIKDKVRLS